MNGANELQRVPKTNPERAGNKSLHVAKVAECERREQ